MRAETKTDIVLPILHLNGTSKAGIIEPLCNFYSILGQALDLLREISPNGRDYYPKPGLMELAEAQHRRRGMVLQSLRDEIEKEINLLD